MTALDVIATPRPGRPALEALVQHTAREYDLAPDRIRSLVLSIYAEFADARVTAFVPVLVERRLRDVLRSSR